MLISTKGTYALRVMIDLAQQGGQDHYICISEISERLNISRKYLESIMTLLSKNGIIDVQRGKCGGYKLNRNPEEYRLLDILEVTEENLAPVPCLEKDYVECKDKDHCTVLATWRQLHDIITNYFGEKTIADLMKKDQQCCI